MADLEKLLEQPDLSTDIKDNGRLNISLLSLNDNSVDLLEDISFFLKTLPPFQHEDRNTSMSLRVLQSIPFWAREKKSEGEGLLNGSKKIYCLVCIAQCKDIDDLTDASSTYTEHLRHVSNPLMATRCLVFGSANSLAEELKGKNGFMLIDTSTKDLKDEDTFSSMRSQVLTAIKHCVTIVYSNITTLLANKNSQKKAGSLPHSAEVTLDEDEMKRQRGRSFKAQGDYHLLLGEHIKAIELYREALTLLSKEYLWLGATIEGILTANLFRKDSSSFDSEPISFELSYADNCISHRGDLGVGNPSDPSPTSADLLSNSDKDIKENNIEGGSGDAADIDGPSIAIGGGKVEKDFQQAIHYYSKAGPIGRKLLFELHLKYAGYLVHQENFNGACKQLNEAQIVSSSEEGIFAPLKLPLYLTLSKMYHTMGLKRKTVFMMFNAGREAVVMAKSTSLHHYGYGDLKEKGYKILTFCLREFGMVSSEGKDRPPVEIKGWPLLQAMLLTEYVHLCLKLEYYDILLRWAWLCLQTFYSYLLPEEVKSLTENISKSVDILNPSAPNNINGVMVQAPFPISSIPQISVLRPQPMTPPLSVKLSKTLFPSLLASSEGPFLYSAINKKHVKDEVLWVQGDPAEVLLVLNNPLPVEMRVKEMTLVLQGAKVNTFPSTIALPPHSDPQQLVLLCIPAEPGCLSLTGYTATIFGLLNTSSVPIEAGIKVLPSLPQLRAKVLPKHVNPLLRSSSSSILPSSPVKGSSKRHSLSMVETLELLDGEACECELQLQSIGDFSVDKIKITVRESEPDYCTVSWENSNLESLLPMKVKNMLLGITVKLSVNIPPSIRIGPSKPDGSHVQSIDLKRNNKSRKQVMGTDRKVKTLEVSVRRSDGCDWKEPLEKSTSPAVSPRRLNRFTGSLRKGKKTAENNTKHVPMADKSNLLNSLDLPGVTKIEKSHDGAIAEEQTPQRSPVMPRTIDATRPKRHHLKETGLGGPKRNSKRKTGFFKNQTLPAQETAQPVPSEPSATVLNSPQTTNPGKDFRLMDSLNLDYPLANDLRVSSKPTDSIFSDNTTDTSSDIVDFDDLSGDRVSITSDPGMASTLPRLSSSPTSQSVKSATLVIGSSIKEGRKPTVTEDNTKWSLGGIRIKKKPLSTQASVPIGGATKPILSAKLKNTPGLPTISSPVEEIKRGALQKKTIKLNFLLQYTGGEGAKEGYFREVTVDLMVSVKPTLYLEDFSVVPIKGSADEFSFVFTMENISPYNLEITVDVKQETVTSHQWVLDSQTSRKVSIPMKRFTLEDQEATLDEASILKLYCDHLVSLLDIRWFTPTKDKTGTLSLTGLKLPQSIVAFVRPLPVVFSYRKEAMLFSVGLPVTITVEITNITGAILPPCVITLKPFTLSSDGSKVDCVKNKTVLNSQSLAQWLPEMSVDFTYKLSMNMVFLCQDEYLIDVKLHKPEGNQTTSKSASDPEVPSPLGTPGSTSSMGSFDITYAVAPMSKTGPCSNPTCMSKYEKMSANTNKLGNITDFISQSKAYAGPPFVIQIQ